jgi:hypothetical protein
MRSLQLKNTSADTAITKIISSRPLLTNKSKSTNSKRESDRPRTKAELVASDTQESLLIHDVQLAIYWVGTSICEDEDDETCRNQKLTSEGKEGLHLQKIKITFVRSSTFQTTPPPTKTKTKTKTGEMNIQYLQHDVNKMDLSRLLFVKQIRCEQKFMLFKFF